MRRARTIIAWVLLVGSLIGWPVTSLLDLLGYDIFRQVMYALSWLAVILVAADLLTTSQVHEEQADGAEPEGRTAR